jgi:hypothetical protein
LYRLLSSNVAYFGESSTYQGIIPLPYSRLKCKTGKKAAGIGNKLSFYCRHFVLVPCGATNEKTGISLEVPTLKIFNKK